MKKFLLLFSLAAALFLAACTVVEFPEPTRPKETGVYEERTQIDSQEISGFGVAFFSDHTCAVSEVNTELHTERTLVIPSSFEEVPVTEISENCFSGLEFEEIVLPDGLKEIGATAFQRCMIRRLTLPDSVETIGADAFDNCLYLETVTLGKAIRVLPMGCFYSCLELKEIVIPEGVEEIGEEAFAACPKLEEVSLPSTLKSIGAYAFWHSGTDSLEISIPTGVEEIGCSAFAGTAWLAAQSDEFVIVGNGVLIAYRGTAESVSLPPEVLYLSDAFAGTAVKTITSFENLRGICENAFEETQIANPPALS